MSRYPDPAEMAHRAASGATLPWIARCLAMAKGNQNTAQLVAESLRAPDRVKDILKGAISAVDTTTGAALGSSYATAQAAFVEALGDASAFFRIWNAGAGGFLKLPMRVRLVAVSADATASLVNEGAPIPMSALSLSGQHLAPQTVAAIVVLTNEVWRDVSQAGQSFVTEQLRRAVGRVVDRAFLDVLDIDGATAVSGNTAATVLAGIGELLDVVNAQAGSRLFWVAGTQAANRLSVMRGLDPAPSPTGGELLGLPMAVSSGIAPDRLALVDASGIAADLGLIALDTSDEAALQMTDTPADGAAQLVSLFQAGATALRAMVTFGAEAIRPDVCASMQIGEAE